MATGILSVRPDEPKKTYILTEEQHCRLNNVELTLAGIVDLLDSNDDLSAAWCVLKPLKEEYEHVMGQIHLANREEEKQEGDAPVSARLHERDKGHTRYGFLDAIDKFDDAFEALKGLQALTAQTYDKEVLQFCNVLTPIQKEFQVAREALDKAHKKLQKGGEA